MVRAEQASTFFNIFVKKDQDCTLKIFNGSTLKFRIVLAFDFTLPTHLYFCVVPNRHGLYVICFKLQFFRNNAEIFKDFLREIGQSLDHCLLTGFLLNCTNKLVKETFNLFNLFNLFNQKKINKRKSVQREAVQRWSRSTLLILFVFFLI